MGGGGYSHSWGLGSRSSYSDSDYDYDYRISSKHRHISGAGYYDFESKKDNKLEKHQTEEPKTTIVDERSQQQEILQEFIQIQKEVTAHTFQEASGEKVLKSIRKVIELLTKLNERNKDVLIRPYNEIERLYHIIRTNILDGIYDRSKGPIKPQLTTSNYETEIFIKYSNLVVTINDLLKYYEFTPRIAENTEKNKETKEITVEENKLTFFKKIVNTLKKLFKGFFGRISTENIPITETKENRDSLVNTIKNDDIELELESQIKPISEIKITDKTFMDGENEL